MNEPWVLGIDGGGTHTRAVLVDSGGRVRGRGEGGPANPVSVGFDRAAESLNQATAAAWRAAGRARQPAGAAMVGAAGLVGRAKCAEALAVARSLELAGPDRTAVDHDLSVALDGETLGAGIVAIAGTGAACFGRTSDGRAARTGGRLTELDDGGSAFDLVRRALLASRAWDAPPPWVAALDGAVGPWVVNALSFGGADAVRVDRARVAAHAPLVTEAARAGEPRAEEVLRSAADALCTAIERVAKALDFSAPRVVTAGALLTESHYAEVVSETLGEHLPAADIAPARLAPELGAARRALAMLGIDVDIDPGAGPD